MVTCMCHGCDAWAVLDVHLPGQRGAMCMAHATAAAVRLAASMGFKLSTTPLASNGIARALAGDVEVKAVEGDELGHELEVRTDPGGTRHYLAGSPVHCGSAVELQHVERRYDDDGDDGDAYSCHVQRWTEVRYEAAWSYGTDLPPRATLHGELAGYTVVLPLGPGMRFRWPARLS